MGRKTTKIEIVKLIEKLRNNIPNLTIRTSLIAGFPSETEEEFSELLEFIENTKFERLGVFAYSQEESTAAARLPGQSNENEKLMRQEKAMQIQSKILTHVQKDQVGKTVEVLTEGYDRESLMYFGRTQADSIEVDTTVYFASEDEVEIGSFVNVKILDADSVDLTGVQIN